MSAENDVPLGEGARRYYEQQFGDRIRKVSKGGGSPRSSGGSNWNGRAGIGIAVGVIVIILRIVLAVSRTSSPTPSYTYTPPPQFNRDWHNQLGDDFGQADKAKQDKQFNDLLRQIMEDQPDKQQPGALRQPDPFEENSLREEEVPLLQGLCYRIQQESLQREPTPGGRICKLLEEDARKLIVRSAKGELLDQDDKDELLEALNDLLRREDLYEAAAFRKFDPPLRGPFPIARYNRQLLEKCYPRQIVPLSERGSLDAALPLKWVNRASADLNAARKEYEPGKH